MKNIKLIIVKELDRFFKDKRMLLSCLILPGLLIYIVYSVLGSTMVDLFSVDEDYVSVVYVVNAPESFAPLTNGMQWNVIAISDDEVGIVKQDISDKETDVLIVFPNDFDSLVATYDPMSGTLAPNIELYYNSARTESSQAYSVAVALLDAYESSMTNKFDINRVDGGASFDLASERDITAQMMMMLPLLILVFAFSSCMAVAPESIAGEKERGTIATLLVTPIKRRDLALGKIIGLCVIAAACALTSFIGLVLSIPKLMASSIAEIESTGVSVNLYGANEYLLLFAVILVTVLLVISLLSVLSAFAKSVKEASSLIMPLYIIVMVVGMSSMFSTTVPTQPLLYLVPLYNSTLAMTAVCTFQVSAVPMILTIVSNIVYCALLVFLLTKLFDNEKVMFQR